MSATLRQSISTDVAARRGAVGSRALPTPMSNRPGAFLPDRPLPPTRA